MIFIHNTYNRPSQVVQTSLIEKRAFPECRHLIVHNRNLSFQGIEADFFNFGDNKGHKAGCLNAVLSGLKWVIDNRNPLENEVLVFSHDDVYLNNIEKFHWCLRHAEKTGAIVRRHTNRNRVPSGCDFYVMLESIVIQAKIAKCLINGYQYNEINENDLLIDGMSSPSPEMTFGKRLLSIGTPYFIDMEENRYGENEMGYFHIENERGKGEV